MTKTYIKPVISLTNNESNILSTVCRDSESKQEVCLGILKVKDLKDFFSRNFNDDISKLESWTNTYVREFKRVSTSGEWREDVEVSYELGVDDDVEEIDWESIAQDEVGYNGSFSVEDEITEELFCRINWDLLKVDMSQEDKVSA